MYLPLRGKHPTTDTTDFKLLRVGCAAGDARVMLLNPKTGI
jgi:hypothetical protein